MAGLLKLSILVCLIHATAWADIGGTFLPPRPTNVNDVALSSQAAPTVQFTIELVTSCFPVSTVGGIQNPLAPASNVQLILPLLQMGGSNAGTDATVTLTFPGSLSIGQAKIATTPVTVTGLKGTGSLQALIAGQSLIVHIPGQLGNTVGAGPFQIDSANQMQFIQQVPPGYPGSLPGATPGSVGSNGPLSVTTTTAFAADGSSLTINVSFPGTLPVSTGVGVTPGGCDAM